MLIKIIFFVAAALTGCFTASTAAALAVGVGYLADIPPATIIIGAITLAIAAFGVTISLFALAAFLFLNASRDTPQHLPPTGQPSSPNPARRQGPPPA